MQQLIDIIKNFVVQQETDYAILINGKWGSGKTYFIKNTIAQEVNKINCKLSDTETKPYDLIYISLYGITSIDELQQKLFLEVNPFLKTKTGKIASTIFSKGLSLFGVDLSDKDEKKLLNIFGGIPRNKILVFDDLERLSTNTLNEVLGFINSYTEHQNLKVIIVADEENIKEKIEDYKTVKEKLIRFTYLFNPELKDVYPSFASRYSSEYQNFLKPNEQFICDFFEKGQHKNLRSLRFVLDLFEKVFLSVTSNVELQQENKTFILIRLLFFFVTYSIEYKKEANDLNLNSLKDLSSDLSNPRLGKGFMDIVFGNEANGVQAKPLEGIEKFKDDFETIYIEKDSGVFEYYDFIVEYIHTGDLDKGKLKASNLKTQEILNSRKAKPEYIALERLKNCLLLNDEEFLPLINEIYSYVDEGKYPLETYPLIFQNILNCSLNGIANLDVNEATVERFKSGMNKGLAISKYQNNFRHAISIFHQEENALLSAVRNYASDLNESLKQTGDKELASKVFNAFESGEIEKFKELMSSERVKGIPIFLNEFIDAHTFLDKYLKLSNTQKVEINETLQYFPNRFLHSRNAALKELPFFKELRGLVEKQIQAIENDKQLSTINLVRFNYSIKEIIEALRNS
jgi:hypothetical protein